MKDKIIAIIRTLNGVEVKGKNNLDMLLGCIMTLEQIEKEIEDGEVDG